MKKARTFPLLLVWVILFFAWLPMAHEETVACIMWQQDVAAKAMTPAWEWPADLANAPALKSMREWNPAAVALDRIHRLGHWHGAFTHGPLWFIDGQVFDGVPPDTSGPPPREPWRYYLYCLYRDETGKGLSADYGAIWRQIDPDNGVEALQYLSCFLSAGVLAWTVLRVCRPVRDHHHARLLWRRTRALVPPLLGGIALLLSLAFAAHRVERRVLSGPPEEARARPAMRKAQMATHDAALRQIEEHFARDFPGERVKGCAQTCANQRQGNL